MASTDVDLEATEVNNPKFPLWKHVTKFVPPKSSNARGGNTRFRCHFCENDYLGSYSRVRAHLLKIKNEGVAVCSKMTSPMLEQLRKEDREASEAATNAAPSHKLVRLPPFDDSNATSSKKRNVKQSTIVDSFNVETRHFVDSHIARLFYTAGS
jgi:hypothetical protein